MKRPITLGVAMLGLIVFCERWAGAQPPDASSSFQVPADEKPFWDSAQTFLDAYAKRDAAAIGDLFTENAEFVDEFGDRIEGREAIVAMYQDVFDNASDASIEEINVERVRHITDTVTLEEGVVVASESADGPRYRSRYVALHTKGDDGVWRINTLKDQPREVVDRQGQLAKLAWLLGEWVNQDSESVVHTECDWSEDGNYLLRRFAIQTFDDREMNGVQRIGWDAHLEKIRSWTFDSEGGFVGGVWAQQGNRWLVTVEGVSADGEAVSGTAVYTVVDSEMIRWQYRDLVVGDEVRGDIEPVTMVRRPPNPGSAPE
jgi:uncharacterized protein (TIGR02246 family)